jgi:hypothetical protein
MNFDSPTKKNQELPKGEEEIIQHIQEDNASGDSINSIRESQRSGGKTNDNGTAPRFSFKDSNSLSELALRNYHFFSI